MPQFYIPLTLEQQIAAIDKVRAIPIVTRKLADKDTSKGLERIAPGL
jgi:hypothetical protein